VAGCIAEDQEKGYSAPCAGCQEARFLTSTGLRGTVRCVAERVRIAFKIQ